MTKLIYVAALTLALAAPQLGASAQGERDLMQQWLGSHCEADPASPVCHEVIV